MPTPSLHPHEQPRPTASHAELRVYDALQSGLPSGWTAWHSLRIHDDDGAEGEGDFVLIDPDRGLLVIEVKGGAMEARDGRWYQNGKPLSHSPRDQAHGYLDKLIRRLRNQGAPVPAHGIATWFPDTPVDEEAAGSMSFDFASSDGPVFCQASYSGDGPCRTVLRDDW